MAYSKKLLRKTVKRYLKSKEPKVEPIVRYVPVCKPYVYTRDDYQRAYNDAENNYLMAKFHEGSGSDSALYYRKRMDMAREKLSKLPNLNDIEGWYDYE